MSGPAGLGSRRVRRFSLGRHDHGREVDDELEFHLAESARELMATGLGSQEARLEAERRLGDRDHYRRQCLAIDHRRDRARQRGELAMELLSDLRLTLRSVRKSPAFLAGTVLTLALGLGGATAVFSVVYGVLLKPLPFPEPDRLVHLWEKNPERGWMFNDAAPANYLDWRERAKSFTGIAAYSSLGIEGALTGTGEPESVRGAIISANFLDVLGLRPALGRAFREEEGWQGTTQVVMLSHELWQRRFAGDPGLVGRSVVLNGRPRTVVGIAPPGLAFPNPGTDFYLPWDWEAANRTEVWFRRAHFVSPVARLKPGVTAEQASGELERIAAQLEAEYPETNRHMGAGLTPLAEWITGESRASLLVLLGAVGLLLLAACANVAHLLLARAAGRGQEMSLRTALGASRGRLIRLSLAESLVLTGLGGLLGTVLAYWGTEILLLLAPAELPRRQEIALHGPVVGFAILLTLATALVFGLVPALGRGRRSLLVSRASVGTTRTRRRTGRLLVVAEVALALVLVAGAGLFGKSLFHLLHVDAGFRPANVLTVKLVLPGANYGEAPQVLAFDQQLLDRVQALPGVESAAIADRLPLTGSNWTSDFAVAGRDREQYGVEVHHRAVSPAYFSTLGVPLVAGRGFADGDRLDGDRVVLINRALAEHYFPNEDPIGKRLCFDRYPTAESRWRTIVGVVGDERVERLAAAPRIEVFQPLAQSPDNTVELLVKTAGDPLALAAPVRAVVQGIDRQLPLFAVRTFDQIVRGSLARERFLALLLTVFGSLALTLAAIGIAAIVSHQVAQRRREIGIRMALGAELPRVLRQLLREGLTLAGAGLVLGTLAALALTRQARGLLYEVSPTDPAVFAAVALTLVAVAALANYLPARKAARIDPAVTLREE